MKTAREKLIGKDDISIVEDKKGRGLMLIPSASELESLVRKIKKGKLTTIDRIRDTMAKSHNADLSCPLVTGIFLRLIAEANEEDRTAGKKKIAPYWRVLKADGSLNEKYPGGSPAHQHLLAEEGYTFVPGKGKKPPKVVDFEKRIQKAL